MGERERLKKIANAIKESSSKKKKTDNIAGAVKKLTQSEYGAIPKVLQKELKEFR